MRLCSQCGKDISLKRPEAQFCSGRCKKRGQRGEDPLIIGDKQERGTERPLWPKFRVLAGPTPSPAAFDAATISDRDPKTGRSSWEEIEERNLRMKVAP